MVSCDYRWGRKQDISRGQIMKSLIINGKEFGFHHKGYGELMKDSDPENDLIRFAL